ncbi:polysaccharide pyruvyl transferase family protein [Spongiibacter sp. KMU-166]|uniref:Polysaccharide pyruvyl transferase family protein n=1 Tax=Spongiibacter thalassae TaxID=2721624 RepID=A0ABX1GKR3_9GAMM|nr:polysaccharide pyruvyl transferase family protein [Spongiibacter thalassae]NKI19560.1 polysaccharide pyruvyl transferase family protein [Spongiibacter thalassae]
MSSKALIIDYWSDYNRGDAMMQVAILQLIKQWPADVVLDSGCNEFREFSKQLDETTKVGDVSFYPSPKLSYFFRGEGKFQILLNKLCLIANVFVFHFFYLLNAVGLKTLLPKSVRSFFQQVKNADVIIWNGRNFRSNKKFFEFFEFFDLCCAAIAALYMGKKVYALGVSIWLPKSRIGLLLLRAVFSRCATVYAREDISLEVLQREIIPTYKNKCAYLPDLSFFYMKNNLEENEDLRSEGIYTIGIVPKDPVRRNSVSLQEYSNYIVRIAEAVISELAEGREIQFKFVNQAVLDNEPNEEAVAIISEALCPLGVIVDPMRRPMLSDLSEAYRSCDFVISSRMHGCIMSAYLGRPFIGIPYDAGAKWGILQRLGECVLVPMEDIGGKREDFTLLIERSQKFSPKNRMLQESDEIESIIQNVIGLR